SEKNAADITDGIAEKARAVGARGDVGLGGGIRRIQRIECSIRTLSVRSEFRALLLIAQSLAAGKFSALLQDSTFRIPFPKLASFATFHTAAFTETARTASSTTHTPILLEARSLTG